MTARKLSALLLGLGLALGFGPTGSSQQTPGNRIRLPSLDVNRPRELPVTAAPVPDRVPLGDPTLEASTRAVQSQVTLDRAAKAPFLRLSVPDPFELGKAIRLHSPPPESTQPATREPR